MEFQLSYSSEKMMLLKCCVYVSKFGKLSSGQMAGHRTGKGQFSFQSERRAMPKTVQTTVQLHSFHMLVRLCSKSFKLAFNRCESRISRCTSWIQKRQRNQYQVANIHWIIEKAREFQTKTSTSASLTIAKLLTVWITTNCEKFLKQWE